MIESEPTQPSHQIFNGLIDISLQKDFVISLLEHIFSVDQDRWSIGVN